MTAMDISNLFNRYCGQPTRQGCVRTVKEDFAPLRAGAGLTSMRSRFSPPTIMQDSWNTAAFPLEELLNLPPRHTFGEH